MNIGYRHFIALIIMSSTMMGYLGRENLSTAIVEMVDIKIHNISTNNDTNYDINRVKHFDWNEKTQGVILGSFYYGYVPLQIINGRLTEIIGTKLLGTIGLLSTAIINFLTPLLTNYYGWFIFSRIVMGVLQASLFQCAFSLISHWIPDNERSTITSMAFIGFDLGSIISSSLSSYLIKYGFAGGWPSVFYVTGFIGTIISIFYVMFITNNPNDKQFFCKIIKQKEIDYINQNIYNNNDNKIKNQNENKKKRSKLSFPWMKILSCPAIYAGILCHFSYFWTISVTTDKVPDYMHNVLNISVDSIGYYSSLLLIGDCIALFFVGIFADILIKQKKFTKNQIRKTFQFIAALGTSIGLFIIPKFKSNEINEFIIVLFLSMTLLGFNSGGHLPIASDLSREYSATIFGIINTIASTAGFIVPYFIGIILDSNPNNPHKQWTIVWYFTAALQIFSGIIFLLIGSSENQGWDDI